MEKSLGVRVPSLAFFAIGRRILFGIVLVVSSLTAKFEEQHLCSAIVSKIEANGAVAPCVILQHAATCAPAVDLMEAEMMPEI